MTIELYFILTREVSMMGLYHTVSAALCAFNRVPFDRESRGFVINNNYLDIITRRCFDCNYYRLFIIYSGLRLVYTSIQTIINRVGTESSACTRVIY